MRSMKDFRRVNGLQIPLNPLQVASWVLFAFIVVHYFAFLFPLLWNYIACKVVVTVCFGSWTLITLFSVYETCRINPADDAVSPHIVPPPSASATQTQSSESEVPVVEGTEIRCSCCYVPPSNPEDKIQCYYCKVKVHSSSKHCIHCNKCVLRFDHHCKWLNTCVGQKNYNWFLTVVVSVTLMTTLSLILSIAFLVESFAYPDVMRGRGSSLIIALGGIQGISIASVIVFIPVVAMVYQLAGFHAMLLLNGITTYEYIVRESARAQERAKGRGNSRPNSPTSSPPPAAPAPYPFTKALDTDDVELATV